MPLLSEASSAKQMRKVAGAVKDPNDPDFVFPGQKEDQVAPVAGRSHPGKKLVAQWEPLRIPRDLAQLCFDLGHECQGTRRVVLRDEIANLDEIVPRCGQNDQSRHAQILFA